VVVGLDPSLTASGIAWPDGRCITHGRAGLTVVNGRSLHQRSFDLKRLVVEVHGRALGAIGVEGGIFRAPDLVVIEGLSLHSKNSGGLSERCHLWWSLVDLLEAARVPVLEVSPGVLTKYATGKGGGAKAAVIDACARRMPQFETGGNDNKADAAWLCAIGMALLDHPIVEVPATHRAALDKLALPTMAPREWSA
jgi:hypothetical protein